MWWTSADWLRPKVGDAVAGIHVGQLAAVATPQDLPPAKAGGRDARYTKALRGRTTLEGDQHEFGFARLRLNAACDPLPVRRYVREFGSVVRQLLRLSGINRNSPDRRGTTGAYRCEDHPLAIRRAGWIKVIVESRQLLGIAAIRIESPYARLVGCNQKISVGAGLNVS